MTSTDAITMLKEEHKAVEQLFKRFENAGSRAHVEKRAVVDRIIEALSVHAAIEEQVFYPVVRATVPDTDSMALESLEEHHIVKWILSELESMSPEDERFDAKVTVLIENVRHHVREEEQDFFPMVRNELGRNDLSDLGKTLASARKLAPTHPHPRSPSRPPYNLVVGGAAGVADRIGDTVNGLAQGYVTAVRDLISVVLGRKRLQASPTGSKISRTTASRVRSDATDLADAAISAILSARNTGQRAVHTADATASSAATGAKRTAGAARRGTSSTARAVRAGARGTATSRRVSSERAATTAKRARTTVARQARAAAKNTAETAKRSVRQTAATATGSAV